MGKNMKVPHKQNETAVRAKEKLHGNQVKCLCAYPVTNANRRLALRIWT